MLTFNIDQLTRSLARIPRPARVAFAAACAERLAPAYQLFSETAGRGEAALLASILDKLWADLQGTPMTSAELSADIDRCAALIPGEEDIPWTEEQAPAEDYVSALTYALRCRQGGEAKEAAWSGQCAYEALYYEVERQESRGETHALDFKRATEHRLVQAELARQQRDLDELKASKEVDLPDLSGLIRGRARQESKIIFGTSS